jgi:ubiquinone/menaquinone biosynthesis C-methylase UbiE
VLEHVSEPHLVISEVNRILRPGGQVVCVVPWVFPYHGYPKNYFNISKDGLESLFKDFSECRIEMNMGPTSALTNLISEYVAIAFSGKRNISYSFFKGLALSPIFLLKLLDKFWSRSSKATRIAATLCALAKK